MNSTVILSSAENSICFRRCSTETILSIQGKETDFVADSTDTESVSSKGLEYEPVTESEDEAPLFGDTSGDSEEEIIKTKVITVTMGDDGDMEFADSERTNSDHSDSDIDQIGFDKCAHCESTEIDTFYRYCQKCYKVRKNFYPPRPKRKLKRKKSDAEFSRTLSQDSGFESLNSQKSTEGDIGEGPSVARGSDNVDGPVPNDITVARKRRASARSCSESDSESTKRRKTDEAVQPLVKAISEPVNIDKKLGSPRDGSDNLCIMCYAEPKSGVFAHGKIAHICCCYKCAVKVWNTAKRCPICNCKVSNVLKAVVM